MVIMLFSHNFAFVYVSFPSRACTRMARAANCHKLTRSYAVRNPKLAQKKACKRHTNIEVGTGDDLFCSVAQRLTLFTKKSCKDRSGIRFFTIGPLERAQRKPNFEIKIMSASKEWTEHHLTPGGWVSGS
jgi:hypothetical protein